ncbi:Syntaphilin family protein [Spironucleus salmonicida]|uniref:Syntaphilin family protein n=1 Tax=Spironucleus salmonicida TaxID=348837 RepID=V6M1N3_9EUKA|nr:Syntaphilin family protein [Spironucleus salmonicida]|eukprot:EST47114.1 hypothetical protein SS50377_12822 [Spironucleus salmonicida]
MSDDYLAYLADIQQGINAVSAFKTQIERAKHSEQRNVLIESAEAQIEQTNADIQLAEIEATMIRQAEIRVEAKSTLKKAHGDLKILKSQIETIQRNVQEAEHQDEEETRQTTDLQKVQIASVLLEDGNLNMDTGLNNLDQVITINNQITDTLQLDLQKLDRISDEINGMQSDMMMARKQLRKLFKRVTNNKCYMALLLLVVLGIFILTIWDLSKTVSGKK